ncbi:MAG: 4Fe-4S dicluster domain-containing protein [Dehalococcoidales bacterium]|nr:4Fe-4S dicluster domain-containing protein [Dehalococcoidales bacterium]
MAKQLVIDPEKCTGCRVCEMVCSVKQADVVNPLRSRIRVAKAEWEGKYIPVTCRQCENPACMAACPNGAIYRDPVLNRMVIDDERCVRCQACIRACPFEGVRFDPIEEKVIKCDLCGGDPQCVRFCETEAIRYVDTTEETADRDTGSVFATHSGR